MLSLLWRCGPVEAQFRWGSGGPSHGSSSATLLRSFRDPLPRCCAHHLPCHWLRLPPPQVTMAMFLCTFLRQQGLDRAPGRPPTLRNRFLSLHGPTPLQLLRTPRPSGYPSVWVLHCLARAARYNCRGTACGRTSMTLLDFLQLDPPLLPFPPPPPPPSPPGTHHQYPPFTLLAHTYLTPPRAHTSTSDSPEVELARLAF